MSKPDWSDWFSRKPSETARNQSSIVKSVQDSKRRCRRTAYNCRTRAPLPRNRRIFCSSATVLLAAFIAEVRPDVISKEKWATTAAGS